MQMINGDYIIDFNLNNGGIGDKLTRDSQIYKDIIKILESISFWF